MMLGTWSCFGAWSLELGASPCPVFRRRPEPDRERYYLLPAMQHGAREKFRARLTAAVVVGLLVAGALGGAIWWLNRP